MTANPETYDTIKLPNQGGAIGGPHDVGEVWASMLWEVYWNMVDARGFDPNIATGNGGNNRMIQLVIDGMKLQPRGPSFVEARDGLRDRQRALRD
jgi:hypothetical protein